MPVLPVTWQQVALLTLASLSLIVTLAHYHRWSWYVAIRTAIFRWWPRVGAVVGYEIVPGRGNWRVGTVTHLVKRAGEVGDVTAATLYADLTIRISSPEGEEVTVRLVPVDDLVWYGKEPR